MESRPWGVCIQKIASKMEKPLGGKGFNESAVGWETPSRKSQP